MTTCYFCGRQLTKSGGHHAHSKTRDHLVPRQRGGKGLKNNIVIACKSCNNDKSNLVLEEFRLVIAYRLGLIPKSTYQFPGELEQERDRILESQNKEDE